MGTKTNLVLGGSGLIGKALQKQLLLKGEQVINLDIREGIDLRSYSLNEHADVDYIWFLAWDSGGAKYISNEKNYLDIYKNNVQLCANVFSFLEKYNKPFLFTSSQLAATDNPYGFTKLLGEKWGKLLGGKIVRMWNVYGWEEPDERSHVIPDLVIQALKNKKIELMTSGEERRQFIYSDDCARGLIQIRDEMKESEFSLTNGHWMQIKEVATTIAKLADSDVVFGGNKGYENLIEPNETYKKFSHTHSLEEGINEIIQSATSYLKKQKINA
jgi:nucleoside-diphosphate-sugar epimerase